MNLFLSFSHSMSDSGQIDGDTAKAASAQCIGFPVACQVSDNLTPGARKRRSRFFLCKLAK